MPCDWSDSMEAVIQEAPFVPEHPMSRAIPPNLNAYYCCNKRLRCQILSIYSVKIITYHMEAHDFDICNMLGSYVIDSIM